MAHVHLGVDLSHASLLNRNPDGGQPGDQGSRDGGDDARFAGDGQPAQATQDPFPQNDAVHVCAVPGVHLALPRH